MTALPPDLREAVETVRRALTFDTGTIVARHHTKGHAALALIEQRLMEYERVTEAARIVVADFDIVYGPIVDALSELEQAASNDGEKEAVT